MDSHLSTTPFGRRTLTLAHVASQAVAKARPPEKAVHKWKVFHAICAAKARIGVSERALAVLNALLTFHPETALTGEGLIVFPSNQQLSAARAWHGAGDAAAPSGGARRLRPGRPPRQPQRQALRAQGAGRRYRAGLRFRSWPARRARRGIRSLGRRGPRRRARPEACPRAHHDLPARHRQDDRDRDRGGRADLQGRAGARGLARGSIRSFGAFWPGFRARRPAKSSSRSPRSCRCLPTKCSCFWKIT